MLDLYLIRHAESRMNMRPELIGGRSLDAQLTERGEQQCERLYQRFKEEEIFFTDVSVAPSLRARRTAYLSLKDRFSQWNMKESELLHELSQGDWEGRPRKDVYTPETLAAINEDNLFFCPPGGESQGDVEARMYSAVLEYLRKSATVDNRVAFFGHGMAFKCLFRRIMGSDPKLTYKIVLDNTSITRFIYDRQGWHLVCVNETAHLIGLERAKDIHL